MNSYHDMAISLLVQHWQNQTKEYSMIALNVEMASAVDECV